MLLTKISSARGLCRRVRCGMLADQPDAAEGLSSFLESRIPQIPKFFTCRCILIPICRPALRRNWPLPNLNRIRRSNSTPRPSKSQGKWDDAAKQYRLILRRIRGCRESISVWGGYFCQSPIRLRPCRKAKKENAAELEIDQSNAGAEYVLGALAQQISNDEASRIFPALRNLIPALATPFWMGSLPGSSKRYSEAIPLWKRQLNFSRKSGSALLARDRLQPHRTQGRRRQAIRHSKTTNSERRRWRRQFSVPGEA